MKKIASVPAILHVLICSIIICSFFNNAHAQDQEPAEKGESCITAVCHAVIGKYTLVHKPVAEVKCTVCHGQSPEHRNQPQRHSFGDIEGLDGICFSCHERLEMKSLVHSPVEDGDCTACHSPHGSRYRYLLLEEGGDLCFQCHDEEMIANTFVHGPAEAGGCIACHDPHSSDFESNLRDNSPNLCYLCHTDKETEFQTAKVVHEPVVENCTNCHNPHSASKQFILDSEAPALCFSCHEEKREWINNAAVQHGALMTGGSCLNCHDPHASNISKRLALAPLDLCLSCHNKNVKTPDGKMLTNMKKLLEDNKNHHGPIRQKDCSGCHNPHGSNEFRMLKEGYPSSFYMSFGINNYNLCFKCHEKTIVQSPMTTEMTNFRNGEDNLHFKHVNKPQKGRTCRACHETHASNFPKHIRESVPFGKWEFPLNYVKSETGGSCAPGCHKLKKYDRVIKVINE